MKILLFCSFGFLFTLPLLAQTSPIKENLGPLINTAADQILPVFSTDGQRLYFSENSGNGQYEVWFSELDGAGNWQAKQKVAGLNLPTDAGKYVFTQVEEDLFLINGWLEQRGGIWIQTTGLSWYIPSQRSFVRIEIPDLQRQVNGRFVNAFLHRSSKTLLLSYAVHERKDLYLCRPQNPSASGPALRWEAPVKLPAPLNSAFDDTTPFLDRDGRTLYFSSNRPGGYGADDIYRSRRLDDSWERWSAPENLGFGVNSNFSEIYYCISPLRDYAYFVSYKHSYGAGDIFRFQTDSAQQFLDTIPLPFRDTVPSAPPVEVTELAVEEYKPNNLVFLIDRSASMRGPEKLPLLKLALKRLIGELRAIDRLTLMSFSDSAITHVSIQGVIQKDSLYSVIDSLEAAGRTKANRGLELAYAYTSRNFIGQGNNEIFLVTDGLFRLSEEDQQRIEANQRIVLSAVGLGDDRNALNNLRELAESTQGSFIRIRNARKGTEALLEEVKVRSRR